jgi:hypothetical protein
LSRAYSVGQRLDDEDAGDGAGASHVDPDLAVLLAKGYEAKGEGAKGNDVRLSAAARYEKVGDTRAKDKVLTGIPTDTLTVDQKKIYMRYRPNAYVGQSDAGEPVIDGKDAARRDAAGGLQARGLDQRVGYRALPRTLDVPANVLWVDTGVDLKEGQGLVIQASGQWSNSGPPSKGPEGFAGYHYPGTVADADLAALIARIGERVFQVGAGYRGKAPASGRLYLSINDTPDTFGDNEGTLSVTINLE